MPNQQNPSTANTAATCPPTGGTSQRTEQKVETHKEEAQHQVKTAKQGVQQATSQAQKKAQGMKESVRTQAADAMEEGRHQVQEQVRRAKTEGSRMVDRQKDRVADEVETFGSAFHEAARKLHEDDEATVASYADQAADGLNRASRYIRERDCNRLLHDVENLSRSRPELVFGGLFLAGLGIARFLKASGGRRRASQTPLY